MPTKQRRKLASKLVRVAHALLNKEGEIPQTPEMRTMITKTTHKVITDMIKNNVKSIADKVGDELRVKVDDHTIREVLKELTN